MAGSKLISAVRTAWLWAKTPLWGKGSASQRQPCEAACHRSHSAPASPPELQEAMFLGPVGRRRQPDLQKKPQEAVAAEVDISSLHPPEQAAEAVAAPQLQKDLDEPAAASKGLELTLAPSLLEQQLVVVEPAKAVPDEILDQAATSSTQTKKKKRRIVSKRRPSRPQLQDSHEHIAAGQMEALAVREHTGSFNKEKLETTLLLQQQPASHAEVLSDAVHQDLDNAAAAVKNTKKRNKSVRKRRSSGKSHDDHSSLHAETNIPEVLVQAVQQEAGSVAVNFVMHEASTFNEVGAEATLPLPAIPALRERVPGRCLQEESIRATVPSVNCAADKLCATPLMVEAPQAPYRDETEKAGTSSRHGQMNVIIRDAVNASQQLLLVEETSIPLEERLGNIVDAPGDASKHIVSKRRSVFSQAPHCHSSREAIISAPEGSDDGELARASSLPPALRHQLSQPEVQSSLRQQTLSQMDALASSTKRKKTIAGRRPSWPQAPGLSSSREPRDVLFLS